MHNHLSFFLLNKKIRAEICIFINSINEKIENRIFSFVLMKFNKNEDLQPVSINTTDSEYTPYCFIDSASFNDTLINIIPIIFFAIVFFIFSFHQSTIPFEHFSEAVINQSETEDKFDIDFSIYNLSSSHKFLQINFYAVKNDESKSDENKKLNISSRYVFQKNFEVLDSNTSLSEESTFYFTNNSNISLPIHLFQHVVDKFDYINIHLYMQGNFRPFQKFVLKYNCTNSATVHYFDQTLFTASLLFLILLIFFNPKKLDDKKLKYNLISMNLFAIFIGIPKFQENRYILFSIFTALLRYFLLSQILALFSNYQSNYAYLLLFIFSAIIINFEYKSLEARNKLTFLPMKQQMIILNEERYMMICDLIFALVLLFLIVLVKIKEKDIPAQRFKFLIISSMLITLSSFHYHTISVFNNEIAQTNIIIIAYFIIFYSIGALSFILFGPVSSTEYRSVDEYDTNLAVDLISDE